MGMLELSESQSMKFSDIVGQLEAHPGRDCSNPLACDVGSDPEIVGLASIEAAPASTLSYIEGDKFASWVAKTTASALILPDDSALQARASARKIAWVADREPRLLFARAIALFYQPFRPAAGIHPTAVVDSDCHLGRNVSIGAGAVVQAGVTIGDDACLHPNVTVYPGVAIGARATLHANCTIGERSQIGSDCTIHCGAVIGSEGFGFVPTPTGWVKMEQSGYVVLEAGVEVGANSTIDRPAVGITHIGANTKIDNLVHIGHGCTVGKNCAFAAQVGLAGGVVVEEGVLLAGQVGVANQARIGKGAVVMAQSGVINRVGAGAVVFGSPALPRALQIRAHAAYQRLPEIYRWFRQQRRPRE